MAQSMNEFMNKKNEFITYKTRFILFFISQEKLLKISRLILFSIFLSLAYYCIPNSILFYS